MFHLTSIVSTSALTWFIRYVYYWNLQFLNNVIINFGYPVYPLWFYRSQNLKLFGFPIFQFWASPDEGLVQKRVVPTKFDIYVFISVSNDTW
jgi:hypothetical protein